MRVISKDVGVQATTLGESLYGVTVDKGDASESSKEKVKKGGERKYIKPMGPLFLSSWLDLELAVSPGHKSALCPMY